jgi:hypothetical protein
VVDGVECLGEIKKDTNSVMFDRQGGRNFVTDVQKGKISGVILAKAILVVMQYIEASEEVI